MANWCNNSLSVSGDETQLKEFFKMMKELSEKAIEEQCGQLPEFIQENNRELEEEGIRPCTEFLFFNDIFNEDYTNFETKWSPPIDLFVLISEKFPLLSFEIEYDECGMEIYGVATISNGEVLRNVYLEQSDFDLFEYNEDEDHYIFEGEIYESDYEIKDEILNRKIKTLPL